MFPGPEGEGLADTQARAVAAVRDWNLQLGPDATWLACSHGDVIKAIAADALGMHLDLFQRITDRPMFGDGHPVRVAASVRPAAQRHRGQRRIAAATQEEAGGASGRATRPSAAGPAEWHARSLTSTGRSASSPARSGSPASGRSTCRSARRRRRSAWRSKRSRCSLLADRLKDLIDELRKRRRRLAGRAGAGGGRGAAGPAAR